MWITDITPYEQTKEPNHIKTCCNQIYCDGYDIYLVPRKLISDNYTMPLAINKSKWDCRPSHLHDIGCKYHQLIKVNIQIEELEKYLVNYNGEVRCKDIPIDKLELIKVGFNECNNLFYKAMRSADIPNAVCSLYRAGVQLNLMWLFNGKEKIDLSKIYKEELHT